MRYNDSLKNKQISSTGKAWSFSSRITKRLGGAAEEESWAQFLCPGGLRGEGGPCFPSHPPPPGPITRPPPVPTVTSQYISPPRVPEFTWSSRSSTHDFSKSPAFQPLAVSHWRLRTAAKPTAGGPLCDVTISCLNVLISEPRSTGDSAITEK